MAEVTNIAFTGESDTDNISSQGDKTGVDPPPKVFMSHPLYDMGKPGWRPDSQETIDGFPKYVIDFGIADLKKAYSRGRSDISHVNFYKVRSVRY